MRELLQQALGALEDAVGLHVRWDDAHAETITALREALAAPMPESVHQFRQPGCSDWYDGTPDHHDGHGPYEVRTLYAAPPAAPEECDMADDGGCPMCGEDGGTSCGMPNCGLLQGTAPVVPLQGGMDNNELLAAWQKKLLQQALDDEFGIASKALRAEIEAYLAAPMPEPVALMALDDINELMHCNGMSVFVENPRIYPPYCEGEPLVGFVPLYFAPSAAPAPVVPEDVTTLRDALETARNGLLWYRDTYPESDSCCDDEAMKQIDAALAAAPVVPRKMDIPPPGVDALDVVYAEGWNAACDAFFGGLPPQPALVVEVSAAPAVREPVIDEMDAIASQYAHKLALDLECVLSDYNGKWWDTAMQTIGEYRMAMNRIHERESPTHMGEPVLPKISSGVGK